MIRPASILLWAVLVAGTDAYQFTLSATTESVLPGGAEGGGPSEALTVAEEEVGKLFCAQKLLWELSCVQR